LTGLKLFESAHQLRISLSPIRVGDLYPPDLSKRAALISGRIGKPFIWPFESEVTLREVFKGSSAAAKPGQT